MTDEYKGPEEKSLRRVLGLPATLTIGLGVMIGSGIFVFPGLAGGRAGIGAAISFGLAGLVALIVALCMAELATAIPRSGGAYYFISRGLGAFWGTMVGLSLWIGLIFATGFYLVAFGYYVVDLLARFDIVSEWTDSLPLCLAAAGSILLTGINMMGASKAGKLQKSVVILLIVIIAGFLSVGLLKSLGIAGELPVSREMPNNWTSAVLATSALIFTSYLGFAQIANVSGEVKKPQKNLPLALCGSVLIAAAIYVITMVVITGAFTISQLEDMGEMAMVELGRTLFGAAGSMVLLFAGLLATISSANASILGSSRILYALGRDNMVPRFTTRISSRFAVPWISLLMVGGPVLLVLVLFDLELLAQVASLLHLIMYALVCISLAVLRRTNPKYYTPSFRIPFYLPLSAAGAVGCFTIIFFMSSKAQLVGAVLIFASIIWFSLYASGEQTRRSRNK